MITKIFSQEPSKIYFHRHFHLLRIFSSLYIQDTLLPKLACYIKQPRISCFHKSNYTCLCYFYHTALFRVDWLADFLRWANLIGFLEFHIAHSEILLTACTDDQLLYNLSLFKLCSACVKQNIAVKTSIDACSLLAK